MIITKHIKGLRICRIYPKILILKMQTSVLFSTGAEGMFVDFIGSQIVSLNNCSLHSSQSIILFGAMQIISTTLYPRTLPQRFQHGETVTLVGQVVSLDEINRKLIIQPDLDSHITVDITIPSPMECAELRDIKFIEVRGTAQSGQEIVLKQYCNFKDNFDLKTYNEVLRLTADPNFRHIFGSK